MAEKEYIEREALINDLEEARPLNWTDSEAELTEQTDFELFENLVKSQSTADVQEVRHGKWVYINKDLDWLDWADCKCSECGYTDTFANDTEFFYNYCPECGAKMDKE